jgi:tetratricopeptide (TPR) repeat protein
MTTAAVAARVAFALLLLVSSSRPLLALQMIQAPIKTTTTMTAITSSLQRRQASCVVDWKKAHTPTMMLGAAQGLGKHPPNGVWRLTVDPSTTTHTTVGCSSSSSSSSSSSITMWGRRLGQRRRGRLDQQQPHSSSTILRGEPGRQQQTTNRRRGILGFCLGDNSNNELINKGSSNNTRKKTSCAPLFAKTRVDSSSWNVPNKWNVGLSDDLTITTGGGTSINYNYNHWPFYSTHTTTATSILSKNSAMYQYNYLEQRLQQQPTPAYLDSDNDKDNSDDDESWIPTQTHMDSLRVQELKQMLSDRGLSCTGRKAVLQERMFHWAAAATLAARTINRHKEEKAQHQPLQQQQHSSLNVFQAYAASASSCGDDRNGSEDKGTMRSIPPAEVSASSTTSSSSPNSLAEWARTVDLEPLLHRRQVIHQEKLQGKKVLVPPKRVYTTERKPTEEYKSILTKIFDKPSSPYSNLEVKQLYQAAKHSDQMGDKALSRRILMQLKECTPHDARIFKRLSRMEKELGNVAAARAILQEGVRGLHAANAFLWHGLGQLAVNDAEAKECYFKAIAVDPSLPHPYHALGTMEHTQGRIANAMKTLSKGVEYCPTNHRLHHALGDIYRDAKMLDLAEKSYRKALLHGPPVSHGFAYTALACTAYEQGEKESCRKWLRDAVALNEGRNANAWVALSHFEESQGNIEAARATCITGLAQYERKLLERHRRKRVDHGVGDDWVEQTAILDDPVAAKNVLFESVPSYRSGDRFFNLYRNWARLEERYGSVESVDEVYSRAQLAFPHEWKITLDWAEYYVAINMKDRARSLYYDSCSRASNRHADPYRLYAEFEMNHSNYTAARKILYAGGMAVAQAPDGGLANQVGLAELFHSWAVCEWHLGELLRAESLFDHALRMTEVDEGGSKLRAYTFYSIAMLEHFREKQILAQHCIALCLKENTLPGGNARVWDLWTCVAESLGNGVLAAECENQAEKARAKQQDEFRFAGLYLDHHRRNSSNDAAPVLLGQMTRRDPWHQDIFGICEMPSKFFHSVRLPFRVTKRQGFMAAEEEPVAV